MTFDVIIPCYYASEIIRPCLESIAVQTVLPNRVILINDCSPYTDCHYQDLRQEYEKRLPISYYEMETNSGPGVVRQYGISLATSDFIWFQDDDDEVYDYMAFENCLTAIQNVKRPIGIISGRVCHLRPDGTVWYIANPTTHHQGSMYNRQLLIDRDIHYEPEISYKEEDCAFADCFQSKMQGYIAINTDAIVYKKKWFNDHVSLTSRVSMLDSVVNLLLAKTYSLQYQVDDKPLSEIVELFLMIPMLYKSLISVLTKHSNFKLTISQWTSIKLALKSFLEQCERFQVNLHELDFTQVQNWAKEFFNDNSFYGAYDESFIRNFLENYPSVLQQICTKVQTNS